MSPNQNKDGVWMRTISKMNNGKISISNMSGIPEDEDRFRSGCNNEGIF
jgi:hypothetical protein